MVCSCSLHKYLMIICMPQIFSNTDLCQDMLHLSKPLKPFQWNWVGSSRKIQELKAHFKCVCSQDVRATLTLIKDQGKIIVHIRLTLPESITLKLGFHLFEKMKKTDQLYMLFRDNGQLLWVRYTRFIPSCFRKWDMVPGEVWGSLEAPQLKTKPIARWEQNKLHCWKNTVVNWYRGRPLHLKTWDSSGEGWRAEGREGERLRGLGSFSFPHGDQEEIQSLPEYPRCRVNYIPKWERNYFKISLAPKSDMYKLAIPTS